MSEYGDILAEQMGETAPFNEFDWLTTFGDKLTSVADYIRSLHNVITKPFNTAYGISDIPQAMAAKG